jgi:hypothetical protein
MPFIEIFIHSVVQDYYGGWSQAKIFSILMIELRNCLWSSFNIRLKI